MERDFYDWKECQYPYCDCSSDGDCGEYNFWHDDENWYHEDDE